jgi:hypothetical protein
MIEDKLEKNGLSCSQVSCMVRDGAANMRLASSLLEIDRLTINNKQNVFKKF